MYFTEDRISRILVETAQYIYPESEPIGTFKMKRGNFRDGEKTGLDAGNWEDFKSGDRWGDRDAHFRFKTEVAIPARFEGRTVVFEVRTGREGEWDALNPQFLVYVNGRLMQGLDVNHREIVLSEKATAGEVFSIVLDAYSGMKESLTELKSQLRILDRETEKLYYDLKVPLDVAGLLDKEDKKRIDILNCLDEAVNLLDLRKPFSKEFYNSVRKALDYMEEEFYGKYCGHEDVIASCVGHTHIDVAWLWTLAQTREKTARTFSTVLSLMKQYPEYIFMSSQPQLYKFIKEDHPEIYSEIRGRIAEGRWEAEGAMWLEADCNISSGESLVRQILFGTRFFEKEFGVKNKILWLPDVFGYSAALPQILKKSGIDYFMTTKISWNEYNQMPYDTFIWKGMDGTGILTHFITTSDKKAEWAHNNFMTTYNGNLIPSQVSGAWQRYQQKSVNNDVLISFGYGDGGGGPTGEMLENARRMARGIPGCPKVKIVRSLDYFKKLEKTVIGNAGLPKWVGELYLEYHRGTYTSMARNKKYNRKSEFLYQDAELLSVINSITSGDGRYPRDEINRGWETILLNQFHDILPGSSIKEVYEESKKQYEEILDSGRAIIGSALDGIASKLDLKHNSVVVFNQLSFTRSDIAEFKLPDGWEGIEIFDGEEENVQSSQIVSDSTLQASENRKVLFFARDVPAKGYKAFGIRQSSRTSGGKTLNGQLPACFVDLLDTRFFNIKFDRDMNITSIYDKAAGREVIKAGEKANVLQAFEDKPIKHDAWDINIFYREKMWEINNVETAEVVENGPVRANLRIRRKFLDSALVQDIYVYNDMPRIDFNTWIDWKERQALLKAAFPVDVHADRATYEIQYGNVERPTHWNTSWDYARFEVCAHKWADLSEDGYGVSLLNDCKYGHDIKEGTMRLTLLKSAVEPSIDADREVHEFKYSLYPHEGDWKKAGTVHAAYSFNCPMYVRVEQAHGGILPREFSLLKVDVENVVVEVVKKAEESDDIIVRLYEYCNRRTRAVMTFFRPLSEVFERDLMENAISSIKPDGNSFEFEIKPYEIKTYKLRID